MRMKTFSAPSMSQALKLVEEQMGKDAVILSSQENTKEGVVHVTAGLDPDFISRPVVVRSETPTPSPKVVRPAFAPPPVPTKIPDAVLDAVSDGLKQQGFSTNRIVQLLQSSGFFSDPDPTPASVLSFCLGRTVRCTSFWETAHHKKPVVFLGTPGVGKTVAVAKLATQALLHDFKPILISSDVAKAGGIEQLEYLTRILKLPLHIAEDPQALTEICRHLPETTPILVDTQGIHAYDNLAIARFQELFPADRFSFVLLSSPQEHEEDTALLLEKLGPAYHPMGLLPTKLDTSRKWAHILQTAMTLHLPLFELGVSASVTHGLMAAHPDTIVRFFQTHQG
jgi:flagellar biosynthesis protein FlhF